MPFEISKPGHLEYIVKKSQFITYLYPVESKEQIQHHLAKLKELYPDARHICYAFLVGNQSGMSDDGEPSGTAGKPMFSILQHHQLINTLAVVVRYFGGIKLGAGGLIRAYGQAVNQCLEQVELVELIKKSSLEINCDFALENKIRHFCKTNSIEVLDCNYTTQLSMVIQFPLEKLKDTQQNIIQLCAGNVSLLVQD